MKTAMPKVIENFVRASNANDLSALLSCFAKDATVVDEGVNMTGHDAIAVWFKKTKAQYNHQTEALSLKEIYDETLLTAKITGTFPGSPANLNYRLKLNADLISELSIA